MTYTVTERSRKFTRYQDSETGKFRLETTLHDQHYYDNDQWQPISEDFVDDATLGKGCNTARHRFLVRNGGQRRWYPRRDISTEYVEITQIQYYTNRWRTLTLPTPVWRNNFAEWDMKNLYVSITHTWKQIKTSFILKNSTAYSRIRFAVTLVGLTMTDWKLYSTTDNEYVGNIDPPTATDANGTNVPVTSTYANGYIEWSVQTGGYTYPIDVDPTFTDGYGGDIQTYADTYLSSSAQSTNYGTNTGLAVTKTTRVSLLRFDLSSISSSATCDSATLTMTIAVAQASACTLHVYRLAAANTDWIETEADWDGKDNSNTWAGSEGCQTSGTDYNATAIGSYSVPASDAAGTAYTITLTASAVEDYFGSTMNLLLMHETDILKVYAASDHATETYRPKLVVNYTSGSSPVSINLDALSLSASIPDLSVVPGAVTTSLDALSLASSIPAISVSPLTHLFISLSPITLASSIPKLTIVPGAIATSLNVLNLVSSIPALSVVPGGVAILLAAITLTSSVSSLSVVPGDIAVVLKVLSLLASIPDIDISGGTSTSTKRIYNRQRFLI